MLEVLYHVMQTFRSYLPVFLCCITLTVGWIILYHSLLFSFFHLYTFCFLSAFSLSFPLLSPPALPPPPFLYPPPTPPLHSPPPSHLFCSSSFHRSSVALTSALSLQLLLCSLCSDVTLARRNASYASLLSIELSYCTKTVQSPTLNWGQLICMMSPQNAHFQLQTWTWVLHYWILAASIVDVGICKLKNAVQCNWMAEYLCTASSLCPVILPYLLNAMGYGYEEITWLSALKQVNYSFSLNKRITSMLPNFFSELHPTLLNGHCVVILDITIICNTSYNNVLLYMWWPQT